MSKINFLLLITCLLVIRSSFCQQPYPQGEPEKCYAQCMNSDIYKKEYHKFARYTGKHEDIENNPNIYKMNCEPQEAGSKYVKKIDRNCLSPNKDDCYVLCLVHTPKISAIEYIVKDTLLTIDYEVVEIEKKVLVKLAGDLEWKEVVCDLSTKLIKKMQKALVQKQYYVGKVDGYVHDELKTAFKQYQLDHNLCYGAITIETLKSMGIKK